MSISRQFFFRHERDISYFDVGGSESPHSDRHEAALKKEGRFISGFKKEKERGVTNVKRRQAAATFCTVTTR